AFSDRAGADRTKTLPTSGNPTNSPGQTGTGSVVIRTPLVHPRSPDAEPNSGNRGCVQASRPPRPSGAGPAAGPAPVRGGLLLVVRGRLGRGGLRGPAGLGRAGR